MKTPLLILFSSLAAGLSSAQNLNRPQRLRVLSVHPGPNVLDMPRDTAIRIRFNGPIDPASLASDNFEVFGRWSGVASGTVELLREGRVLRFVPDEDFAAGEHVTLRVSPGIESPLLRTLGRPVTSAFWVDSRAGSLSFTLVDTLIPGDTPYGSYGGDLDDDGDLDLCIPNEDTSDVSVFLNQGGGVYGPATSYPVGLHCSSNEGGDLDGDGDTDLVIANILDHDMSFLRGRGDGTFDPQVRHGAGNEPRGITLIDCDGDGDLDAFTSNRISNDVSMFLNDGGGNFAGEVRLGGGVLREINITMADLDTDGRQDLVVVGHGNGRARAMISNGDGTFTLGTSIVVGANPWMVVAGDVDADGDDDIAVALAGASAVAVAMNDGAGNFSSTTSYPVGSFPIAVDLGDLDGDGDLDLGASSFSGGNFTLYLNQGSGTFASFMVLPAVSTGSCMVMHDFDGDGDVDLTGIDEIADLVFLWSQDG